MSCSPFRPHRRPARMPAALVAALLTMFGCQGETSPPTSPETPPALTATSTAALAFRQLSLSNGHTCGVTTDDTAWCWGDGVLGDGTFDQSSTPIAVTGGLHVGQVTSSGPNCLLTTDGLAYCWGFNWEGELGDGTTEAVDLSPVAVAGNRRYTQIHAGFTHACALTASGAAFCWGQNAYGELGTGTGTGPQDCSGVPCSRSPVRAARGHTFVQVKVGSEHTCGLDADHRFWCWGNNEFGQLGDGTTTNRLNPVEVVGSHGFRQVSVGAFHTCGVTADGTAWCWGMDRDGRVGAGSTSVRRRQPFKVRGGLVFSGVSAGVDHTCGVTTGNVAYCWGNNDYAQLGDGTTTERHTPSRVAGSRRWGTVIAGWRHSCGVTEAGRAFCWGNNEWGQLGDGTKDDHPTPVAVVGPM
jgi:alpha-tubulin suppressor-like RCC1 family protein